MAKNTVAANGAAKKTDLPLFRPEDLTIVDDEGSALRDDRAEWEANESLVLSIMVRGVLQPVIVRKNTDTGAVEVVDGRQRVKAAIEANKRLKKEGRDPVLVPGIPKRTTAADSLAIMVTANELRTEDTPLNRAKKLARYLDIGGNEEDACVMFGVSKATIKNMLALLDAPSAVRKAVESGQIAASDGYKLSKLDPEEAKDRVEKLKADAPRTPGKKRSKNAKKAKAIVNGGSDGLRSKKEISAMLKEIQTTDSISENKRLAAEASLQWVLGDDEAIMAVL